MDLLYIERKNELKFNSFKIIKKVSDILSIELNNISTPCHMPKLIIYLNDLKRLTGLDSQFLKEFKKTFPDYFLKFGTFNDELNLIILYCMLYYTELKSFDIVKLFYQFLALRLYTNTIFKYFPKKFCSPEIWELTMNKISPRHLFRQQDDISNVILYLANVEYKKYERDIIRVKDKDDLDQLILKNIIYRLKHRLNQSVKSFAVIYNDLFKDASVKGFSKEKEVEEENINISNISDKISSLMTTYSRIDKESLTKSISMSGIDKNMAISILNEISIVKFKDKISFIIILFNKIDNINKVCSERMRNVIIRKSLNQTIGNRYNIKKELNNIVEDFKDNEIKNIKRDQVIMFLLHYLTLFVKYRICS